MVEQQVIAAGVPDLRQREKEQQFRQRAIQEKLETLSCAIFVQVASSYINGGNALQPIPNDVAIAMGTSCIDASLAMGKALYGVTAIRADVIPPVKEATEPF